MDHERKSIARNEYFIGNYGPHALRTAVGHRADPVRGRVRRLGAQHLIAQQISTHKLYRRPVRESDRGVSLLRRMSDAGTEPCAVPFKTRAIKGPCGALRRQVPRGAEESVATSIAMRICRKMTALVSQKAEMHRIVKWIGAMAECRLLETRRLLLGFAFTIFAQTVPVAIADQEEDLDAVRNFAEAYEQIRSRYVDPLDNRNLVADAIKGMLSNLDPYSDYLDPIAYEELRQETQGIFGGLGMEVSLEQGAVKVISAFEGSPAYHAGLQAGDLITRLGETDVAGLTLEQAIQHARGEPDTSITLTVLGRGGAESRIVTVRRAIIQARSVKSAQIDAAYFYLKITHFHKHTAEKTLAALAGAYQQAGTLNGVVLDLRDNPGGSLMSAAAVSATFLPEGALVVYTESASPRSRMRLVAKPVYGTGGEDYSVALHDALPIFLCRWWYWSMAARLPPLKLSPVRCRAMTAPRSSAQERSEKVRYRWSCR